MSNPQDNASFGEETTAFLNLLGSGSRPCNHVWTRLLTRQLTDESQETRESRGKVLVGVR